MSLYEPCTWNMSAVQLISNTTSGLSLMNAIQAMITASTYWRVVSTGLTASNYKYVEAAPLATSKYADYRVLFVEKGVGSGSKGNISSAAIVGVPFMYLCPDGGTKTLNVAAIETTASSTPIYTGTSYYRDASGFFVACMPFAASFTAIWMYECDGAMYIVNRESASQSYAIYGIGQIHASARTDWKDFNSSGTEVGVAGMYFRMAYSSATTFDEAGMFTSGAGANGGAIYWTRATAGGAVTIRYGAGTIGPSSATSATATNEATYGTYAFNPITVIPSTSSATVYRGVFMAGPFTVRTTIKDSTGTNTLGYTYTVSDTTSQRCLCFMNMP